MSTTLNPEQQKVVEKIQQDVPSVEELQDATRTLKLSDAMRLGSQFTEQAYGWGTGEQACALHAAALGAVAAHYLKP